MWDRLSLDLRIERDFKDEPAFEREEQGSVATTVRGERGKSTHQLRSASNVQISPGATRSVSVREVHDSWVSAKRPFSAAIQNKLGKKRDRGGPWGICSLYC